MALLDKYLALYGTHSLGTALATFIHRAPPFPTDVELATALSKRMGLLEEALTEYIHKEDK
jgi:hypothetical protein